MTYRISLVSRSTLYGRASLSKFNASRFYVGWITDLLFNAGSGGLFGMVGSLATTWMRLREKKLDNQFQLDLLDKQAASAEAVASWSAFTASQSASASDMTEKVAPWAANVRAVTRPALTAFLVVGAFIAILIIDDEAVKANALQSFQMLAGTSVAWWFGSRMTTQINQSKR